MFNNKIENLNLDDLKNNLDTSKLTENLDVNDLMENLDALKENSNISSLTEKISDIQESMTPEQMEMFNNTIKSISGLSDVLKNFDILKETKEDNDNN